MARSLLVLVVLVCGVRICTAQPAGTIAADIEAWIQTSGWLLEARDLVDQDAPASASGLESIAFQMKVNRLAVNKLENALRGLPEAKSASRDELPPVAAIRGVVLVLKEVFDRAFAIQQRIVAATNQQDLANVLGQVAQMQADLDEAWKTWPQVTILLSYGIVDMGRSTNGSLQHLRLATRERRALIERLDKEFPKVPIKMSAGQHAVEAGVSALKTFLRGDHKSSDSP
jgi:hypothetical protein